MGETKLGGERAQRTTVRRDSLDRIVFIRRQAL
jgi:hypothetical protein